MALVETGLDLGKGDGVDHERGEVHPGVPVAVKGGGIAVAGIPVRQPPNDGRNKSHDNPRSPAHVPSHYGHGGRVEGEQAQFETGGPVNPSQCRQPDKAAGKHQQCLGFALESARVVADKVANRIIARHAKNLLEPEYLEATLVDTNEIVNEELKAFEEALKTED